MGKNIKTGIFLLLFAISGMVIFGLLGVFRQYFSSFSVRFSESGIEEEKAKELQSQTSYLDITLWSRPENGMAEAVSLGKKRELQVIFADGDIKKVMPMKLLSGMYLLSEDKRGCMIEERAAYSLFGSKDVVGKRLEYQNEVYEIRGVVKAKRNVCIFRSSERNRKYENMELTYNKEELWKDKLTSNETYVSVMFIGQLGIEPDLYFDGSFAAELAELFFRFLTAVFVFCFCIRGVNAAKKNPEREKRLWKQGFFLSGGFLVLLLLFYGVRFPDRLIPTKWSDFQFWDTLFEYFGNYKGMIQSGRWEYKEQILKKFCIVYGFSLLIWLISLWKLLSAFLRKIINKE